MPVLKIKIDDGFFNIVGATFQHNGEIESVIYVRDNQNVVAENIQKNQVKIFQE